jgi:hypothetical protein
MPDSGSSQAPLEVHALGGLDVQVTLVRLAQLILGHTGEPAVHVHELTDAMNPRFERVRTP